MIRHALAIALVIICTPFAAFGSDLSEFLPETVSDMQRLQLVVGDQAQQEVDQLHGKALPAKASAIGRYLRPKDVGTARPAEVWLSRVSSEKEARRQVGVMVHKMYENPKSPFKNPKKLLKNGISVYRFTGMGQVHLIWHVGDIGYWISAQPDDETLMLDTFCR
ncbi:hypothetical protein GO013_01915 [Pseudodesulfovibrio sp. JC047]|uniref:hypothetical protein n=1 Tax=Pseudodesulfovibrio sp. JC047 TaxID=2683199 RepID=UPI0013D38AC1|nr:hypothetical protein [Pseudodesulfovibrio sp. JC047]NDV18175.1 hypothetical protein [Pseudodesulfovibrio sp. JC047]